mgnify:CR=1 FL=1
MDTYNKATIRPELAHLKDWKFEKNAIEKQFEFELKISYKGKK